VTARRGETCSESYFILGIPRKKLPNPNPKSKSAQPLYFFSQFSVISRNFPFPKSTFNHRAPPPIHGKRRAAEMLRSPSFFFNPQIRILSLCHAGAKFPPRRFGVFRRA